MHQPSSFSRPPPPPPRRRSEQGHALSAWSATRLAGFKQWTAELAAGDFDAAAIDARLDREIGAHGVIMFSFSSCPFCKGAKELLDAKQAAYAVLELDEDEEGAALRARLGARTGRTSVPSVWIGGNCGGWTDRRVVAEGRKAQIRSLEELDLPSVRSLPPLGGPSGLQEGLNGA
ncbi:hypothetical protein AB1Y20_016419 [Prymnesium parvum]|uniref:Glutaredoxin domain-containing protein n=1 Tax=Prymnesium parvum TaxID=97485 RepID=A0AB34ICP1_PRYPA